MLQPGISIGVIVGGVMCGLALMAALTVGLVYLRRQRRKRRRYAIDVHSNNVIDHHVPPMSQVVSPSVPLPKKVHFGVTREQSGAPPPEQSETISLIHVETSMQAHPGQTFADSLDATDNARQLPQVSLMDSKFCNFISRY